MSKRDNLSDFLVDLYQGISAKKPGASRNPQDFRGEIEQIETKSPEWDGSYETSPDTDIVGGGECEEPNLITKTATENKTYYASDDGADGYSEVSVEVPMPVIVDGSDVPITANGTYEAKDYGVDGISKIVVAVPIPDVPEATAEERTVTPTKAVQVVTPQGADYLSKVTVEPIPDAFIQPTDNKHITENGENIDVREYATVSVDVASSCDRPLGFWFMTDTSQTYDAEWDENDEIIDIYNGVKESITVPPQVQDGSATSFRNLFSHYYYDGPGYMETLGGVWVKEICGVINCANVTDLSSLFSHCVHTEKICDIVNTGKVKNFYQMFFDCTALVSGPTIDVSGAENLGSMYWGCQNLERMNVKNVKISFTPYANWGGLDSMTTEGWADLCYELVNTGSKKTLTIGKSGITALQSIYIKDIDDSDPKKSFTLCESTDEGAITLADYVTLKNWALAGS